MSFDSATESSSHTGTLHSKHHRSTGARVDTLTSTYDSSSDAKRAAASSKANKAQFSRPPLSPTPRSYLNQARDRLAVRQRDLSPESFDKSVDRLISSTHKKYRTQPQPNGSTSSSSLNYISQYYATKEEPTLDGPLDSGGDDDDQQKFYYSTNTNRTHKEIMKNLNKSLIDRNYPLDENRRKYLQQNVRRYLRFIENQSLQRELNDDLIRCFSSAYLDDLRREDIRHVQTRIQKRSYTYEDIQDIHMSSILDAYKMKTAIDRERYPRLTVSFDGQRQSSIATSQLSPMSSSAFSPVMIASLHDHADVQSGGFETDRRSLTSVGQSTECCLLYFRAV